MDFNLKIKTIIPATSVSDILSPEVVYMTKRDILIKRIQRNIDVRRINVIKQGSSLGLVVDQIIDSSLLLNGAFIDITDPIQAIVETNYRYKADYSFVDLGLKSHTAQTDGNHSLTLSVRLGDIANLNGILTGIPVLGPLLNGVVKGLTGNIVVSVPTTPCRSR